MAVMEEPDESTTLVELALALTPCTSLLNDDLR